MGHSANFLSMVLDRAPSILNSHMLLRCSRASSANMNSAHICAPGWAARTERAQGRVARVHATNPSKSSLRTLGESAGDPGGLVALRNSSNLLSTEAVCSSLALSSHSLAAAKRVHPARLTAKFTSPHFGCHCGPASSVNTPKNAGTNLVILRLDASDLVVLFATSTALTETVSMVCPSGIN